MDFTLTSEQKVDLKKQQKQTKDKKEYRKISVILFLDLGLTLETIAKGLGIGTVSNYSNRYQRSANFSEYLSTHYNQNIFTKSTNKEIEKLKVHLDEKLYTTCKSVVCYIAKEFGKRLDS